MSSKQLPLSLRFPGGARFETFLPAQNAACFASVQAFAAQPVAPGLLVVGEIGSGKTHLALAVAQAQRNAALLPLRELAGHAETALAATPAQALVIIDDVDAVAGQRSAEVALFDLFNRVRDGGGCLLMFMRQAPAHSGLVLPDLVSRLSSLSRDRLTAPDDATRRQIVRARGESRGLGVSDEVLDFLFRRYPRDLGALIHILDRLDRESLARQRRLTIQLVREVIGPV